MTTKHIDEVRCKICKGVYPDESDLIDAVWLYRNKDGFSTSKFIGYFCHFCLPPSAYLHSKDMVYTVDRMG